MLRLSTAQLDSFRIQPALPIRPVLDGAGKVTALLSMDGFIGHTDIRLADLVGSDGAEEILGKRFVALMKSSPPFNLHVGNQEQSLRLSGLRLIRGEKETTFAETLSIRCIRDDVGLFTYWSEHIENTGLLAVRERIRPNFVRCATPHYAEHPERGELVMDFSVPEYMQTTGGAAIMVNLDASKEARTWCLTSLHFLSSFPPPVMEASRPRPNSNITPTEKAVVTRCDGLG
jgi:hypothetical protein